MVCTEQSQNLIIQLNLTLLYITRLNSVFGQFVNFLIFIQSEVSDLSYRANLHTILHSDSRNIFRNPRS